MAYASDDSGRYEIYVQPYPGPGNKFPISTSGGTEPVWSRDGKELFFRHGDEMMAVAIELQGAFSAGAPRLAFGRQRPDVVAGIWAHLDKSQGPAREGDGLREMVSLCFQQYLRLPRPAGMNGEQVPDTGTIGGENDFLTVGMPEGSEAFSLRGQTGASIAFQIEHPNLLPLLINDSRPVRRDPGSVILRLTVADRRLPSFTIDPNQSTMGNVRRRIG